ncbi:replicative DNA helicase [Tenacibaculum maritimum]|nr:replicative DNA helicase [Tenacibaculum maritimum]MDB0600298.1 replicative DNA helicase [Tenacibaculum maritimum]MDB0602105.1 replicative DNA helicase [Tenacibaculum maritimum]MDB0610809.1 replicative DNA helicase [Tenacibaculum maritimum]
MANNIQNIEKGKLPPQAIDLEEAVLGAMLIDKNGLIDSLEILTSEVFYKNEHKVIFSAIKEVYINSEAVDLLTVSNALKKANKLENAGGDFYLIGLTQKVASSAHIDFHSRIILQKYIQRELIKSASSIVQNSYREDVDVFNLLDTAYNHLNEVGELSIKPQESSLNEIIDSVVERGVKIYNGEIKPGVSTPIRRLTKRTGGWRDGELIIMAARPGMGKTSFALLCALNPAKEKIPTAFFSLEMNKATLTSRILSMEYLIDNNKFMVHGLSIEDQSRIYEGRKSINDIPLFIDDTAGLSIEQFQIKAKRLKSKHNIKMIVVDYLQLMTSKAGSREQEISKISRGLKKTALDLGIPIIALSQLSRAVETRGGNKRPQLSDLRESGAIEQDADMVMFFYRPEYYGLLQWDEDEYNFESTENQAEYIVAKNRNGGLVKNRMKFEGKYTLFSDLESDYDFQEENLPSVSPSDAFEFNNEPDDNGIAF